ncbi:MAG: cytochrome c3 family protein [Planctomycetota bacterium]|jgi:hypothetical protein
MESKKLFCISLLLLLPVAAVGQKLGDESDGSKAPVVHRIPLIDESGEIISPADEMPQPFSTNQTCQLCHSYEKIAKGWHFNAADANIPAGRAGQPWIFTDADTATQIPLSYRDWPGTFKPEQIGLSSFKFTQLFARHMPGGGPGELDSDDFDEVMRQFISGKLEINCLSCHNNHHGQDQAEYAAQVKRQNFRWAPTGACEFASVKGSAAKQSDTYDPLMSDAISVTYDKNAFDDKGSVLVDIVKSVPDKRCYFCHSSLSPDSKESQDDDIHLTAGLSCIDCHRNGLDHNTIRGYENESQTSTNPLAAVSSCKGCHLGDDTSSPTAGRLGSPVPAHRGIPPIHFEKLSCTACHSGTWPENDTHKIKTSRAHGLGTHGVNKSAEALPHIVSPVFAKGADGKIAPHNLIWPAFWASMNDSQVSPISIEVAKSVVGNIMEKANSGDWPSLTDEQLTEVLSLLSAEIQGKAAYVCGGRLYSLGDKGKLISQEHEAGAPYLWPIGHNVRPAAQSLGSRNCKDCHSTDAALSFGKVAVDTPLVSARGGVKEMVEFQDIDPVYIKLFALSFVFRPWLKAVAFACCAVLAAVLLLYALRALKSVTKILADWSR